MQIKQRIKDGGEEEGGAVEREHIKSYDLGVAEKSKILTGVKETFLNCDADIFYQNIQMAPNVEVAGFPGSFTSSLFL